MQNNFGGEYVCHFPLLQCSAMQSKQQRGCLDEEREGNKYYLLKAKFIASQ